MMISMERQVVITVHCSSPGTGTQWQMDFIDFLNAAARILPVGL